MVRRSSTVTTHFISVLTLKLIDSDGSSSSFCEAKLSFCYCWLWTQVREIMLRVKGGKRPPWVGLGAAVWVQIASGNGYCFPLYSHSLKSVLGFNQSQITLLGVSNVCNKFPPWLILFIGALLSFLGVGVFWLAITKTLDSLPFFRTLIWFQNRLRFSARTKRREANIHWIRVCEVEIWHWIEWSLRVREIAGQMLLETFESFPTKSSALF